MRSWLAAAAAAIFLAGCGTGPRTPPPPYRQPLRRRVGLGPGRALVRHLVAEMIFPPGTKPASLRSVPRALRDPGPFGKGSARAERLLLARPGWPRLGSGTAAPAVQPADDQRGSRFSGPGASSTLLAAPEAGIDAAVAAVWAEPWSRGTTLIAAYAFATSLPVRTAAEHLDPGRFGAVTLSARELTPPQRTPRARSPRPPLSPGWRHTSTGVRRPRRSRCPAWRRWPATR